MTFLVKNSGQISHSEMHNDIQKNPRTVSADSGGGGHRRFVDMRLQLDDRTQVAHGIL